MTANCAVIVAKDEEEARILVEEAILKGAQALEFRLDAFSVIPGDLSFLACGIPSVATLRSPLDEERKEIFLRALASGAKYIDIESDSVLRNQFPKEQVICSYHDFEKTPAADEILTIFKDLHSSGIPKAAFMVRGPADLLTVWTAASFLRETESPFILIGMGAAGEITRLRSSDLGSMLNYCALRLELASAPGQITLEESVRVGTNPLITAVIGYPLTHTSSPEIHNAAFKAAKIPGRYVKIPSAPEELHLIPDVIKKYRITGMNVTIPHKESVIPFLNRVDPLAESAGAVNTIRNSPAGLEGYNTDILGIAASLASVDADPKGAEVLIIGAGGAAKAAAAYLKAAGAHLSITNRTHSRAETLARRFGARVVRMGELSPDYTIILNATPAGMSGFENHSPVPNTVFTKDTVVMDMIYDPEITPLLAAAKAAGVRACINGKTMLIEQAAASFTLWTGIIPDRDVMRKAFEARAA
ncbi:MAG: shikimate dehydrogenase [Methanocorpusculum sp.]|uniref:shikimate dehydrogenase n=1 Tax=Methanocorpusculum sp. TaxID=2058474 RepID=UPI00271802BF|nr:shikimate dehydrogenase [Methanocorpusculum sp.]MDO9522707.1 shikimate dehydrogenase [Methanocorpusculum sp.]